MSARRFALTGLVSLCVLGCVSLFASAPAVAAAPTVEEESVSDVTASSATLEASIDPGGSLTTYYFQYGTSTSYGTDVPAPPGALAGSGSVGVKVSQHVQGLSAGTVYHYRVVAVSEAAGHVEEVAGPDRTFTTEHGGSALGSLDARRWELVTPADKQGALFYGQNVAWQFNNAGAPFPFVAQAAADGKAIVDLASQPTEVEPPGAANEVSVLSTRGSLGWSSEVIAPPHEIATGPSVGDGSEYRLFSEDLSRGIVQPFGNVFMPLSPEATESTAYLRTDYLNGNVTEHCRTSCYRPLVTRADTREGVKFGGANEKGRCEANPGEEFQICGPRFTDATPDLSHIILQSNLQLTSTPNERIPGGAALYEWSGGQLQPLFLLPKSEGGVGVAAQLGSSSGFTTPLVDHQLSDGGSVFFSYKGHLYMHDFAKDESVRLDVAQDVAEPSEGGAAFMYASSDGSRVFFTDSKQLTKAPGGGLYECRIVEVASSATCELELTGLPAGSFIGGSEDASYMYFVGAGERLIVDRYDGREWTAIEGPVIPQIAGSGLLRYGSFRPEYRISPNGRFLAFMSSEKLTGYDNRDALSGQSDMEVYLYDASSNRLVCASCNPTGARPVGTTSNIYELVSGAFAGGELWAAANLPPWTVSLDNKTGYFSGVALYQPRFLSDTGRLFFDSVESLVPQDVNGTQDVYEYEPAGVGSCSTSSVTFGERSDGCVGLVSSGSSPEESAFMDASQTGGDVFFLTAPKLVSADYDDALDVYDAHECTTAVPCFAPEPVSPPVCSTGDACKAAPTPQPTIFGAAPSATFSGTGDVVSSGSTPVVKPRSLTRAQKLARALRSCRKKGRRQRAVCERVARGRYGPAGKSGGTGAKRKVRG